MNKALLLILFLCGLSLIAPAQQQQRGVIKRDVLLSKGKPSLYITFERFGDIKPTLNRLGGVTSSRDVTVRSPSSAPNNEQSQVVWLRFHNNSCWAITFPTDSLYIGPKTALIRLNDGRGALAPREGVEVNVRYRVEAEAGAASISTPVIQRTDVLSNTWLASGRSVIFAVSREHLKKDLKIYIPFHYEWETAEHDSGSAEPEHHVYFQAADLPKELH